MQIQPIREDLVPHIPLDRPFTSYDLLTMVADLVRERPARLFMDAWTLLPSELAQMVDNGKHEGIPECGTAGCIAGWVNILARPHDALEVVEQFANAWGSEAAQKALDILFDRRDNISPFGVYYDRVDECWRDEETDNRAELAPEHLAKLERWRAQGSAIHAINGSGGLFSTYPEEHMRLPDGTFQEAFYGLHDGAIRVRSGSQEAGELMSQKILAVRDRFESLFRARVIPTTPAA